MEILDRLCLTGQPEVVEATCTDRLNLGLLWTISQMSAVMVQEEINYPVLVLDPGHLGECLMLD